MSMPGRCAEDGEVVRSAYRPAGGDVRPGGVCSLQPSAGRAHVDVRGEPPGPGPDQAQLPGDGPFGVLTAGGAAVPDSYDPAQLGLVAGLSPCRPVDADRFDGDVLAEGSVMAGAVRLVGEVRLQAPVPVLVWDLGGDGGGDLGGVVCLL